MNKSKTEEFIKKAKSVHGEKYEYSQSEYVNNSTKIKIMCKIHGIFEQSSNCHINRKQGCPKCGGKIKLNTQEFIKRAKDIHGNKYIYSESKYINSETKVQILCKFHDEYFWQSPNNHLNQKQGCPKCGFLIIKDKGKDTKEIFIEKAIKIHGDIYNYDEVEYFNNCTKVKIICKIHGIFEQTPIIHLYSKIGCPICAKLKVHNKLRKPQEQFIKEAFAIHEDKYGYSLVKYSNTNTKVQILCKFHNEYFWQTPAEHLKGHGCPKCGKLKTHNKLKKLQEQFIEEAFAIHGNKYDYSESEYTNSKTKVQILCKFHNEYFWQTPDSHLNQKQGCPKCASNIKSNIEQFIEEAFAIHGNKYDYSESEYTNSKTKLQILCKSHNEYFWQTPDSHLRGSGCPKCSFLTTGNKLRKSREKFIIDAQKIHDDKYEYNDMEYVNHHTKINITCPKHGIFQQVPNSHLQGAGCPHCSNLIIGNKLRKSKQQFIEEAFAIHGDKYDYSESKYIDSKTKLQILCKFHNEYFWQTPNTHLNGSGCPKCAKLKFSEKIISNTKEFIEKAIKIHGDKYLYDEVDYTNSHTKVKIICQKHGEFKQRPYNHLQGQGCPKCASTISKQEIEINAFIKSLGFKTKTSSKKIIKPQQLDIFVKSHNIAIEYNGLFWHSEIRKSNKNYHLNKTLACEKLGIKLIHIFEDEWLEKEQIVKSRLLNLLKLTPNKIFARKCIIKEVSSKESREFLESNHIQGNSNSKIRLGLYYNNKLVSLMTFGTLRKNLGGESKEGYYELTRFSNILNTNVVGGASKLFKHFVKNYKPKQIISYADRRWSQGDLYKTLGFQFVHDSAPCYFYFKNNKRENRFLFRKDILVKEGYDSNKTEHEIMLERKIYRIYDCGAKKYVINF